MSRCPKGYTLCSEAMPPGRKATNCISQQDCEMAKEQKKGKKGKTKYEGGDQRSDYEKEQEGIAESEEKARKAKAEKLQRMEEFVTQLQQGILIDPETGEMVDMATEENTGKIIGLLLKVKNSFGQEFLDEFDMLPHLDEFLTILSSESVTSRQDVARGLLDDYLSEHAGPGVTEKLGLAKAQGNNAKKN